MSRAQLLRATPTPAEIRLWRLLAALRADGFHFRKQVQIGPYVADFACHHAKLVIEVDGETHGGEDARRQDARRDGFLMREGYSVLRFSNSDVLRNGQGVFEVIAGTLAGRPKSRRGSGTPLPSSPTRGEVTLTSSVPDDECPGGPGGSRTSPLVGEDGRGD